MAKQCVLYDRICNDCGECDYCDLNPLKKCDNCGKCIDSGREFNEIRIDSVILPKDIDHGGHVHHHDHDCGCGHNH